jgi:hypothetical protein
MVWPSKPPEQHSAASFNQSAEEGVFTPYERKPEQAAAQRIEVEPVANEPVLIADMEYQSHS